MDNGLKLKIENGNEFLGLIQNLKELFTSIKFTADENGLRTAMLDPSHTMFLELKFPKECFIEYEYNGNSELEFGVDLDHLRKIRSKPGEELVMEVGDKINLQLKNGKIVKKYNIGNIVIDESLKQNPNIEHNNYVLINGSVLTEFVKDITDISGIIKVILLDDKLKLETGESGGIVGLDIDVDKADDKIISLMKQDDEVKGLFNSVYLLKILKILNIADYIELKIDSNKPLQIRAEVLKFGEVRFLIAPIIEE